jgi:4-oxalocrotonate tautomerase
MPYLNARLGTEASAETTAAVASLLTELTADVLSKKRELTSVAVDHLDPRQWFIGGVTAAAQGLATFYLEIKITEGTNTKDEKAAYVAEIFAGMEAILGQLHPASYVVIHEVRADAWGYQGLTQEHRYIHGKRL